MSNKLAQSKRLKQIALKAAVNYYGLSSRADRFTPNVKVYYYPEDSNRIKVNTSKDDFLDELNTYINSKWDDNIGSLSKTARLGLLDFAFYVNQLRKSKGMNILNVKNPIEKEILIKWMKNIADINNSVILVELEHNKKRKYLLVNTAIIHSKVLK
jgi:hypothetical protein